MIKLQALYGQSCNREELVRQAVAHGKGMGEACNVIAYADSLGASLTEGEKNAVHAVYKEMGKRYKNYLSAHYGESAAHPLLREQLANARQERAERQKKMFDGMPEIIFEQK